jgi:hypothetical protein
MVAVPRWINRGRTEGDIPIAEHALGILGNRRQSERAVHAGKFDSPA